MKVFTPRTVAEVVDSVNQSTNLRIAGVGTKACFASQTDPEQDTLYLSNLVGIERLSAEDQIAIVLAGTTIAELQEELKKHRMCLPLPCPTNYGPLLGGIPGTVGGLLSMNLPHGLYAQYGGPRDWTLGVTVVRADGTVAKSGAQTVKNVAGYDAHKLFVGARGTLGVIAKVILRLYPERGIPAPLCRQVKPWNGEPVAVQRVLRSDFADALHANDGRLYSFDEPSSTLWIDASAPIKRSANDWVLGSVDTCPAWWQTEPAAEGLVRHAKDLFDPNRKLNRHESPR